MLILGKMEITQFGCILFSSFWERMSTNFVYGHSIVTDFGALVDMYVKCGLIIKVEDVLEELPVQDVVS